MKLHHQVRGSGPHLFFAQGGDGDADACGDFAALLTQHFTVVTWDRRGQSRSPLPPGAKAPDIATHAEDLHALALELSPDEPVFAFGMSMGGVIELEWLARHPERLRKVFVHEPPLLQVLPAQEHAVALADLDEIAALFETKGLAAMRRFLAITGVDLLQKEPGVSFLPPRIEQVRNSEFFMKVDGLAARRHRVDFDVIRENAAKVSVWAGTTTRGKWIRSCAEHLAAELNAPLGELPGGHNGPMMFPKACAAALLPALIASSAAP